MSTHFIYERKIDSSFMVKQAKFLNLVSLTSSQASTLKRERKIERERENNHKLKELKKKKKQQNEVLHILNF